MMLTCGDRNPSNECLAGRDRSQGAARTAVKWVFWV